MVELIINSNKYSRIVSPKILTKIDDSEKERLISTAKEKLISMHNRLLDSSINTVSFDIYASSPAFNYEKCSGFQFFINDAEARVDFTYCTRDYGYFERDFKKQYITLATFHNRDDIIILHYDPLLFSDFLEQYAQIDESLNAKLQNGETVKDSYIDALKEVSELLGLSSPVKIAIDESDVDEINVNKQSSNEEEKTKVSNITINGRTIKIITDDEITVVKPKKRKEKQKRLGGGN